jgi:serine/threonine protein kinase
VALYQDPVLKRVLPQLLRASSNAGGAVRSRSGFVFPPYLVLERGGTLQQWKPEERSFFEIVSMVAALLNTLHASGRVHRDLKPDNVLHLLPSTQWRLLDLGIVANIGARRACMQCPEIGASTEFAVLNSGRFVKGLSTACATSGSIAA